MDLKEIKSNIHNTRNQSKSNFLKSLRVTVKPSLCGISRHSLNVR